MTGFPLLSATTGSIEGGGCTDGVATLALPSAKGVVSNTSEHTADKTFMTETMEIFLFFKVL